MDALFFSRGFSIGCIAAIPVGPIGVLCIRRALEKSMRSGLFSGLGAATADAFYGAVAAFGLTSISGFVVRQEWWLEVLGGVFLGCLGVRVFVRAPAAAREMMRGERRDAAKPSHTRLGGWIADYVSTIGLTLANPVTILPFVAFFAGFGLGASPTRATAIATVAGVFAGSAIWWLLLSFCVVHFRRRITTAWMEVFHRVSGVVLVIFGLYLVGKILLR